MIEPVIDCLLVKVAYQTKESYVSDNGLELFLDPDLKDTEIHSTAFEQIDYRQLCGTVIGLPKGYSSPHYFYDRLVKEIEVGDKIYFHYTAIDKDSRVEYEGEYYYLVPYEMVWCAIRGQEIIMIGSRVFCEELSPEGVEEIVVNGHKIKVLMSKSGIVTEMNVRYDSNRARIVHIGKPLIGNPELNAKKGDIVYYSTDSDFVNIVEGKKYFCMLQEDILATEKVI